MEQTKATTVLSDHQIRRTVAAMAAEIPQREIDGRDKFDPLVGPWVEGAIDDVAFLETKDPDGLLHNRRTFMLVAKRLMLEAPGRQPDDETMGWLQATMGGVQTVADLVERVGPPIIQDGN